MADDLLELAERVNLRTSCPRLGSFGGNARRLPRHALSVKGKIFTVDLPHKLGAKFNFLFKLFFGLAV